MALDKTAEEYEASAKRSDQLAEESFQRSDTDGFLSQWASQIGAQRDRANAQIVRNGGKATFRGLYEGDRRVIAKEIAVPAFNAPWVTDTQWLLGKDEVALIAKRGKRYLPTGSKSRVLKALGLAERMEWAPAEARILSRGKSTGLAGAANAYVGSVRTGDEWGSDATPMESANGLQG